jgi:hypothetical protein
LSDLLNFAITGKSALFLFYPENRIDDETPSLSEGFQLRLKLSNGNTQHHQNGCPFYTGKPGDGSIIKFRRVCGKAVFAWTRNNATVDNCNKTLEK